VKKYGIFGILEKQVFRVKKPCSEYTVYTEYPNMADFWYPKPVWNYCVIIELLFLQKKNSNLNFNRKFDYNFGTQGLNKVHYPQTFNSAGDSVTS